MTDKYKGYLESDKWQLKRKEFFRYCFDAERYFCWLCGEKDQSLFRVHHVHYRNVFKEKMEDLTLLCDDCHQIFHRFHPHAETKAPRKIAPAPADPIVISGKASLNAFNGWRGADFSTGEEMVAAWVAHSNAKRRPSAQDYADYCQEHPEASRDLFEFAARLVSRRTK